MGAMPPADMPAWLRRCHVGALPMRRDAFLEYAFPNKLGEFVIMGKPVITARLRGLRHTFSEDALAYFEPNDPADLARQMIRLYHDETLRAKLAETARREYAPIRWDVMKQCYLQVIDAMAGTAPERSESHEAIAPAKASDTTTLTVS